VLFVAVGLEPCFYLLDRADQISRDPGPYPACQPRQLHFDPEWRLTFSSFPYGALILASPVHPAAWLLDSPAAPPVAGFLAGFLLGLGGTTPVGRVLLGRGFEVITMERFSYWATLLALPFVGLLARELIDRFRYAGGPWD
jgi:hypothetical protein